MSARASPSPPDAPDASTAPAAAPAGVLSAVVSAKALVAPDKPQDSQVHVAVPETAKTAKPATHFDGKPANAGDRADDDDDEGTRDCNNGNDGEKVPCFHLLPRFHLINSHPLHHMIHLN
jgi:hypothetical protein